MANKLVLVPEDLYRGLLTTPATRPLALDNDDIGAQFVKRKMFAYRRNKRLNTSARNTLYQQELRRYLKLRKQAKEKPIKVELDKMEKLLEKLQPQEQSVVMNADKTNEKENDDAEYFPYEGDLLSNESPSRSRQRKPRNSLPRRTVSDKLLSRRRSAPHVQFAESPHAKEPTPIPLDESAATAKVSPTLDEEKMEQQRKPRPTLSRTTQMIADEKVSRIKKIINQNPHKFGVTQNKILNNKGEPIQNSAWKNSLLRILLPNPETTFDYPGTGTLQSRIYKDPAIMANINEKPPPTTPKRATQVSGKAGFTPNRWKFQ